ncbi:DUF202 domain-containing protein [Sphingomonas fennica]|nr:DUF202 domain-containing protein [Sphingomonas fennica]
MSFQRTRMSADRTLMSVIRTSLSLISFGFTIHQLAQKLKDQNLLPSAAPERTFGTTLVAFGIMMLTFGIVYHVRFMIELRRERRLMAEEQLIHGKSGFPPSLTLITAILLLILGVWTIASMLFKIMPFN